MAQQSAEFQAKVDDSHKGNDEPKQVENQKATEESKPEQKTENKNSLFGSLAGSQNLFNNTGVTLPGSLFGGSSLFGAQPSTGLFASGSVSFNNNIDLSKPGPSLFGINYSAQQNKSDESGGEEDGDEGVKDDEEEPKQIVMKFEYQEKTEQLVKVGVEKFRRNANDVLEKGSVALEKQKTGDHYYFIYRNAIQQILYTGQLIKGFSDIKPLGAKAENIIVKAISAKENQEKKEEQDKEKESEKKQNIQVDTLKVMFTTKEGVEEFKTAFAKLFQ